MFKKKGLLKSQHGQAAGEGVAYLKSVSLIVELDCSPIFTACMIAYVVDRHDYYDPRRIM